MYRLIAVLLLISLVACNGKVKEGTCPDGSPYFITTDLDEAFPAYVKESEAHLSVVDTIVSKAQVKATLKTKAIKLRQDLDQERSELETRLKSVHIAHRMTPCDKAVRDTVWKLLGDIKTQTPQISERVKQLTDAEAVKLESEVSNLLHYSRTAKDKDKPPTIIETVLPDPLPRHLFEFLSQSNDKVILSIDKVGTALRDHKVSYYKFREDVKQLEDVAMVQIGRKAKTQDRHGWEMYLKYLVLRYRGMSQSHIMKYGNFLNYDITWDDCEQTYQEFLQDERLSHDIQEVLRRHEAMVANIAELATEL